MDLSVVVPTLDGRDLVAATLDALVTGAPDAEVVVVNGPSTDGTTGMVRERDDVDVLVEIADRTVNAARNAGLEHARGDVVAFVNQGLAVTEGWYEAVTAGLDETAVVTGPVHEQLRGGKTTESVESKTVAGREITHFNGGNVAFERAVLADLDGFDGYLDIGGSRDVAHRLAGLGHEVTWQSGMGVERAVETDGGSYERDWGWKFRSLSYRLVKNYGIRPGVLWLLCTHAGRDAIASLKDVLRGEDAPSAWLGTGRTVLSNIVVGIKDGRWARSLDRTPRRNPYGASAETDRAVAVYDSR